MIKPLSRHQALSHSYSITERTRSAQQLTERTRSAQQLTERTRRTHTLSLYERI